MRLRRMVTVLVLMAGIALATSPVLAAPRTAVEGIREALLRLPYYSVFDFLSFTYDKGTVTLMGYGYRGSLKRDAERAVKRVAGVDTVVNKIEDLPASLNDDDLRWQIYEAIYRDDFLFKYAPGGGVLWGHRHAFHGGGLQLFGPTRFPGSEPAGDYPIHVVVRNGWVILLGVVDNDADKTVAGVKARGVPGSFGLDNELVVERPAAKATATK